MWNVLFIIMLGLCSLVSFGIAYGFIPWEGKGKAQSEERDVGMKKTFKVGGFGTAGLFVIYMLEELGLW